MYVYSFQLAVKRLCLPFSTNPQPTQLGSIMLDQYVLYIYPSFTMFQPSTQHPMQIQRDPVLYRL